ncbi:MAG: DUF4270 family protein [Bacteroidales bacterium]|nr:DUF4270 family protein [Bacteroidales bacterium]
MNKLTFGRKKNSWQKHPKHIYKLLVLSIVAILITSCEKELTSLGKEILPPGDGLLSYCDSTSDIKTYTTNGRELNTYRLYYNLLGSIKDPYFGSSSASMFATCVPYTTIISIDQTKNKIDSVYLYLLINKYIGDSIANMEINIYEITSRLFGEGLNYDSTVYNGASYNDIVNSGIDPSPYIGTNLLGTTTIRPKDSIIVIQITDTNYINRLFSFERFDSAQLFKENFQGLYVTSTITSGDGAIITLNMANNVQTRMEIVYHDTTVSSASSNTLRFYFFYPDDYNVYPFNFCTSKLSLLQHDHTNSEVYSYINDSTSQDSIFIVQGMGGINSVIRLAGIDELKTKLNKDSIIIAKAELILKPAKVVIPEFFTATSYYPSALMLYKVDDSDPMKFLSIPDHLVYNQETNYSFIDGTYNSTDNYYMFNLTYYVKEYFKGKIDYKEFILVAGNNYQNSISTGKVFLNSSYSKNPIQLKIFYTIF